MVVVQEVMNYVSVDSNTKRETGRKAQLGNIETAKVFYFPALYIIILYYV